MKLTKLAILTMLFMFIVNPYLIRMAGKPDIDIDSIEPSNIINMGGEYLLGRKYSTIESLIKEADQVVMGRIIKVEYLPTYEPLTISYLQVKESYIGNIKPGEIIEVSEVGGIVKLSVWKQLPQYKNAPVKGGGEKPVITEEDEDKYICSNPFGFPLAHVNTEAIFFLRNPYEGRPESIINTYTPVAEYQGKFIKLENSTYKRNWPYGNAETIINIRELKKLIAKLQTLK